VSRSRRKIDEYALHGSVDIPARPGMRDGKRVGGMRRQGTAPGPDAASAGRNSTAGTRRNGTAGR
jgi:hypothetical protein